MSADGTYAACLTPAGTGAIATLALHGIWAWPVVRELFQPAAQQSLPTEVPESGRVWPGQFGAGIADEVVLSVKQSAPLPWVEVHCHGGSAVVAELLKQLEQRGAKLLSWSDFLRLTEPPCRAAALERLAQARTARTAAILLDQANGAFDQALESIRGQVQAGDLKTARAEIDELLTFADLGCHLVAPWQVVIAGAPNVGKSSLVNALAGFQRSIVAPIPGTTRDLVTTEIAIDGWPIELIDTAGQRTASADLEHAGIELARQATARAGLIVWVLDAAATPVWPEAIPDHRLLLAINKIDLQPAWEVTKMEGRPKFSARTGAGIAGLCAAVSARLVPVPPSPGRGIPFLASQVDALKLARACLDSNSPTETLAAIDDARMVR
jgi:tRNA modification GTPase